MWLAIQVTNIVQDFVCHALEEHVLVALWAISSQVEAVLLAERIVRHAPLIYAVPVLTGIIISHRIAMNALGAINLATISHQSMVCAHRPVRATATCAPLPLSALFVKKTSI